MRLYPVLAAIILALFLGASAASLSLRAASAGSVTARFLFDFGDGTYAWSSATIPTPDAPNATWNATLAAASGAGVFMRWSWSSSFGVYITDAGNRSPPAGGVGLFLWNQTVDRWDALLVGISSLVLRDGDAVAVSDNAFDSVTYATLYPVPTPSNPTPVLEFRGDAENTGRSASVAPHSLAVRWDRNLDLQEIPSSPAVAFGSVYILTLDGLFALDESNGTILWSNPLVRGLSTPAVFNGVLILGGSDGRIHAIDAFDGHELWNTTLIAQPQFSGVTSSPKILFDTAYVGTFNETGGPGEVVALWATNGTIRWRHSAPASISFSSPAIADGVLFVGLIGDYNTTTGITYDPPYGVLALDGATGTQRWFHETNASVAASPLVFGSELIVPAKDGYVYALDAAAGTQLWKADVSAGVSSPVLVGSTVVVAGGSFGSGGRVTALDAATGAVRWTFTPNGPVQASVAAADGLVFFSTNTANGTVYALDANSGRLAWSYMPSPAQYIFGSPVVADGFVFAPSDNGHVYCFQAAATQQVDAIPLLPVLIIIVIVAAAAATAVAIRYLLRRPHGP